MLKRLSDKKILEALNEVDTHFQDTVYQSDKRIARKAEQEIIRQVVDKLLYLIGDTRFKDGFKEGIRLAEQLYDLLQELKAEVK